MLSAVCTADIHNPNSPPVHSKIRAGYTNEHAVYIHMQSVKIDIFFPFTGTGSVSLSSGELAAHRQRGSPVASAHPRIIVFSIIVRWTVVILVVIPARPTASNPAVCGITFSRPARWKSQQSQDRRGNSSSVENITVDSASSKRRRYHSIEDNKRLGV